MNYGALREEEAGCAYKCDGDKENHIAHPLFSPRLNTSTIRGSSSSNLRYHKHKSHYD